MLHRAAGNAYSWWWASHIRTKQSKWLEQNLQDMEDRVQNMITIIDDDGDSFAQRAEMYYKKRPELLGCVEESYRAYRALAERYDHLSRELQSANRTIASAFPEQVQLSDDDEDESSEDATTSAKPEKLSRNLPDAPNTNIPKVPQPPMKDLRSPSLRPSRKEQMKRTRSIAKAPSGLTKSEALGEIDKLQKGILALQTEKEFVKCLYEHNYARYWDIEDQISDMQSQVCSLQDEFGIGTVIPDEEARKLMAATALKSCQATLNELQEKQEQSAEKAKVENQRIKEAVEKFENLRDKYIPNRTTGRVASNAEYNDMGEDTGNAEQERTDVEMLKDKIKKNLDANLGEFPSVTQLTETIDELVGKVVSLETEVSSQTALVKQLQSETDELNSHIQELEGDKETLIEDSENMKRRLKELEEELRRVKYLSRSFKEQNKNLQNEFSETNRKLDHLNEKLPTINMEEEIENAGLFQEKRAALAAKGEEIAEQSGKQASNDISTISGKEEQKRDHDEIPATYPKSAEESCAQSEIGNSFRMVSELPHETMQQEKNENHDFAEEQEEENDSSWGRMFTNGFEDREKFLLEEYTSVLRDYNEVKKKLGEVEKKNRDGLFELAMQVKELRNANSLKDQLIQSLRQQLSSPNSYADEHMETSSTYTYSHHDGPHDFMSEPAYSPYINYSIMDKSAAQRTVKNFLVKDDKKENQVNQADKSHAPESFEDKLRSDIDELLEENLEFWLRFSSAFHQIKKFQTSIRDLQAEWYKVRDSKKQEGSARSRSLQSEARPIYKHLREIQTELTLWLENNKILHDELQDRYSTLCAIKDEISRVAKEGNRTGAKLNHYQAAKFQGEVLNMKQENRKIAEELQAGIDRVGGLQREVEKTLTKLDDELGISASKNSLRSSSSRPRIPLRSFLFGVKLKKQKQAKHSLFACMNPALQKQYSDIGGKVRRV